jgi:hypothetical protein
MSFVLAVNLIPIVLMAAALLLQRNKPVPVLKRKRIMFECGIAFGTIGAVLLIGFLAINFIDPSHVGHVNAWGGRVWIAATSMAIVSLPLSCMGSGPQRLLAVAGTLVLVVLLYVGGLATSI